MGDVRTWLSWPWPRSKQEKEQVQDWFATGWYRVLTPSGNLWSESSDREECINEARRKGYPLFRLWRKEYEEWRPEVIPPIQTEVGE